MARITGLRGASIWRDDVKKLLPFYRDVLGLKNPPISRRMYGAIGTCRWLLGGPTYRSFGMCQGSRWGRPDRRTGLDPQADPLERNQTAVTAGVGDGEVTDGNLRSARRHRRRHRIIALHRRSMTRRDLDAAAGAR
jgi:hypothetical protein